MIFKKLQDYTGESTITNPFGIKKEEIDKEGIMYKPGTISGWNETYLILRDGMLFVFDKRGGKLKSKLPLYGCTCQDVKVKDHDRYAFELTSPESGKSIVLSTLDEIEHKLWLNAIIKQQLLIDEVIDLILF